MDHKLFACFWTSVFLTIGALDISSAFPFISWLDDLEANGYDHTETPTATEGRATDVQIQFYVESIGNFKVASMDYDIDIYFIEHWYDPRLDRNLTKCIQLNDRSLLRRLWTPDMYFANSKQAHYNDVTMPNFMFRVCQGGKVRFSLRISIRVSCHMNLKAYPLDTQKCHLKILPYGNSLKRVNVTWTAEEAITINPEIMEADLKLHEHKSTYCNGTYYGVTYSCLLAEFYLHRTIGQSALQVYVPTLSIVIISWISFWIDPTSVPGRTGLAVTTLLTLATQAAGIAFQLPPVGYAKALDVWLSVCLLFLFGSLIEFTVVNMYTRRWQSIARKENFSVKSFQLFAVPEEDPEHFKVQLCDRYRKRAILIDKVSRGLFPALFAVFMIVYFTVYSQPQD